MTDVAPPSRQIRPAPVGYWQAFAFWLKLGCISFGGPAGQIAVMHEELVERRRWISERRFLHALNFCMVLPGPEAQQLATYIGWLMHRTIGGITAGALFVLPSLVLLVGLSWLYAAYGHVPFVAGLFYGIKPAVAAIVLQALHRIGGRTLKTPLLWAIAAAAFAGIALLDVPFPAVIGAAALTGWIASRMAPHLLPAIKPHAHAADGPDDAVIGDDGERLPHTRFRWPSFARVALAGALLWLIPIGALAVRYGWAHTWTQMGWFFTKAALLTFGGAYAVLPYVFDGATGAYGWLRPAQMIDGLALGETTPGPLIMVVAFVGFVGSYSHAVLGPDALFAAGAIGAVVVTWFTFLPSFLFILAGGPLVESTHGEIAFTAPLTAITGAVVGAILNLTVFFAYHVLWPRGFGGPFDPIAAGLTLTAAVLLMRLRMSVARVIVVCAVAGLLLRL